MGQKAKKEMTFKDLPDASTKRWVRSRKMAVVTAIEQGLLNDQDACERYDLSEEELLSWKRLLHDHGPDGLRTTHLKEYRQQDLEQQNFQIMPAEPEHPVA